MPRREKRGGKKTIDKKREGNDSRRKLRIGSWNVCGFATDKHKRIKIAE